MYTVSIFLTSFVMCGLVCLVLGYIAGRLDRLSHTLQNQPVTPAWLPQTKTRAQPEQLSANKPKIEIETSKVVTKVDTSAIQKPDNVTLGTVTTKQEDINGAASRLAQLKGK